MNSMKPTTESLVDAIERHHDTVEEVAVLYALAIKDSMSSVDWTAVNAAVVKAHSKFFLLAMKRRAWEIVEGAEANIGIRKDKS